MTNSTPPQDDKLSNDPEPGPAEAAAPAGTSPTTHGQEPIGPIDLARIAHGGAAVGRDDQGKAVFVEGGLPGEQVLVRPVERRPRWTRGMLAALPDPVAGERVLEPTCQHYGRWPERGTAAARHCGGCRWQHATYEAQLRFKRRIVLDALERLGGIEAPPVAEVIGMPDPWRYRNTLTTRLVGGRPALVALDGHTLVPLSDCPISHPRVTELIESFDAELPDRTVVRFRAATGAGADVGERMILIEDPDGLVDEIDVGLDASVVVDRPDGRRHVAAGRPFLVERFLGRPLIIPAGSFFQVNTAMAEQLATVVRAAVPEDAAIVVDAYCGVGTWTVALAGAQGRRRPESVWAIDDDGAAIAAAVDNAHDLPGVTLIEGDAAEGLAHVEGEPDVVLVDPPRGGLGDALLSLLGAMRPRTIVYVSCEPATLARDVESLGRQGYRLASCQPVYLFPQTEHVETVSTLLL